MMKKISAILLVFALVFSSLNIVPLQKVQAKATFTIERPSKNEYKKIVAAFAKGDKDVYENIIVNTKTNAVTKDREKISTSELADVLDTSNSKSKALVQNTDKLLSFVNDDTHLKAKELNSGIVMISNLSQSKRLMVTSEKELTSDFGATRIIKGLGNIYLLAYTTEEDTIAGYEQAKQLGYKVSYDAIVSRKDTESDTQALDNSYTQSGSYTSWGVKYMGFDLLQNEVNDPRYIINPSPVCAIIDSGYTSHSAIKNPIVKPYDFINQDTSVTDIGYHGTHVVGIFADCAPDNFEIMPLAVFDDEGASTSTIDLAIRYAVDNHADVINMSLGIEGEGAEDLTALDDAIDYAYKNNVPCVVAAGNGDLPTELSYPANNAQTIAIACINDEGNRSAFSDYGKAVDFSAPGEDVVSTYSDGTQYLTASGTSMSSPHMAAMFAYAKFFSTNATVSDLYQSVLDITTDIDAVGKDDYTGNGVARVSADNLPAFAHCWDTEEITKEPTCTETGIRLRESLRYNIRIEEVIPATGHQWDAGTIIKYPSYVATGQKIYHCINCTETKTVTIPKLSPLPLKLAFKLYSKTYTGKPISYPLNVPNGCTVIYRNNTSVGKASVTIIGHEKYIGTNVFYFNIVPRKTKITSTSNKKAKKLTIKYAKANEASKNQIFVSTNSKFTKNKKTVNTSKSSYTLSNCKKGKTYYVKVRSYKVVQGKKYYSAYSSVKKIKIRK